MKVRMFSLKTKVLCTTEMPQDLIEEAKLCHEVMKGYQQNIYVLNELHVTGQKSDAVLQTVQSFNGNNRRGFESLQ